ncbi:MAG TPA: O-antigen polymerase [Candidatus Saccharimonadales bacterium]|nr:O-antigen polymerase [Candidatus Saccharimonadales bacterium]
MAIAVKKILKSFLSTDLLIIGLFFILSLLTIKSYILSHGIVEGGESSIYINNHYYNFFSMWEPKINFGFMSFHQSNIYLFSYIWVILSIFQEYVHPSVIFIFLSTFLASLFFYLCLRKLFPHANKYLFLPPALLYTFNLFRTLGPVNERLDLLFVVLPVFFYLFYKLVNTQKLIYLFYIVVVSILSSSLGANLPLFTIPYLLMLIYIVFYLLFSSNNGKKLKISIVTLFLFLFVIIANLFWMIPLAMNLLPKFSETSNGLNVFSALASGYFFDHFRFIGAWSWRSYHNGNPYYPFYISFDYGFFLISTLFIAFLSFSDLFFSQRKLNHLIVFFNVLGVISFILLAGEKGPFGLIYNALYFVLPLFRIYREPFAKFTPLFIFAMSFNLYFALETILPKIMKYSSKLSIKSLCLILSLVVILNAYPLLTGEAMPARRWNGAQWGNLVKIPSFWTEMISYLQSQKNISNVLVFPYTGTSSSHNWEYGLSVAGNALDFLYGGQILRGWSGDISPGGISIASMFDSTSSTPSFNLKRLLQIFRVSYVLQENDVDWRYSSRTLPPSLSNKIINEYGLSPVKNFGEYTTGTLSKILNEDRNDEKYNELYAELLNRPALTLYKDTQSNILPLIYPTTNNVYLYGDYTDFKDVISLPNYNPVAAELYLEGSVIDTPASKNYNNLTKFNEYIAVPQDFQKSFKPNSLVWNKGWAWPEPQVDPSSLKYKLIEAKETVELLYSKRAFDTNTDLLIWLLAKRASELEKFQLPQSQQDYVLRDYLSKLKDVINVFETYTLRGDDLQYWDFLKKFIVYNNRDNDVIYSAYGSSSVTKEIISVNKDFLYWLEARVALFCTSVCFKTQVPIDSVYNVYVDKSTLSKYASLNIVLRDLSGTKLNSLVTTTESSTLGDNYWINVGQLPLKKETKYLLDVGTDQNTDVLSYTEWKQYNPSASDKEFLSSQTAGYIGQDSLLNTIISGIRFGRNLNFVDSTLEYKDITKWNYASSYLLSFDYNVSRGSLIVAVVEDIALNNSDKLFPPKSQLKNVLFSQNFSPDSRIAAIKECGEENNNCLHHFQIVVTPSFFASHGYVFLQGLHQINGFSNFNVENLKVEEIPTPKVILEHKVSEPDKHYPNITYAKIDNNKYNIHVENASDPYTLVFSQTFNQFWKLYDKSSSKTSLMDLFKGASLDKVHYPVRSYFNGWYLTPIDFNNKTSYDLTLEFIPQQVLSLSLVINIVILLISIIIILFLFLYGVKKKK